MTNKPRITFNIFPGVLKTLVHPTDQSCMQPLESGHMVVVVVVGSHAGSQARGLRSGERESVVTHPLLVTNTRPCVAASHWLAPDLSRAVIGGETSSTLPACSFSAVRVILE